MSNSNKKTIVVLGASHVGLSVTHKLLKKTLNTATDYKVVLIAPNTHLYWNIAAPRAVVPGLLPDTDIVKDIRPGFSSYPASKFQHIVGLASSLSTSQKTVSYIPSASPSKQPVVQSYDILVIATGSSPGSKGPWKTSLNGHEETLRELHELHEDVGRAKSIVIGGGGATGVETAAELAFEYGAKKEITIITGATGLISADIPTSVQKATANELKKLKVNVIYSTKIVSSSKIPGPEGKTELLLSDGTKKVVDLYIPTLGMTSNSEWVTEKELLNENGEVIVDDFLKVKGVENVWAAGDISSLEPNQLVYGQAQGAHLAKNLDHFIKGQALEPYKKGPAVIAVTLGRSKGTGRMGNWKFPSIVVWAMKGRTLFLPNLKVLVEGNA